MAHSNRPAAQWTVSVEDLGENGLRQVVQVVRCSGGQIQVRRGN